MSAKGHNETSAGSRTSIAPSNGRPEHVTPCRLGVNCRRPQLGRGQVALHLQADVG